MATITTDEVTLHRVEMFLDLGFNENDAFVLGDARGLDGFRLSHHDVEKYLADGATHEQVVRIFT